MKTISFSVPDEVYDHMHQAYENSGHTFFGDYLKDLFKINQLERLKTTDIKLSTKDGDIIAYFLLMCVLVEIVRRLSTDKAGIKQLPKAKREMYQFIADFTETSFMRISELNNTIQKEVQAKFGLEYDYNIQFLTILMGKIIKNFYNRPVLLKKIEDYATDLKRKHK